MSIIDRHLVAAVLALSALLTACAGVPPQPGANRVVFHVVDNDPARWNLVLNNMENLRAGVGGEAVEIELVAYGPGVFMLKRETVVRERVAQAVRAGVQVRVCQNTMDAMKLQHAEMLDEAGYVPAGVVEIMRRQQQGWSYIRP